MEGKKYRYRLSISYRIFFVASGINTYTCMQVWANSGFLGFPRSGIEDSHISTIRQCVLNWLLVILEHSTTPKKKLQSIDSYIIWLKCNCEITWMILPRDVIHDVCKMMRRRAWRYRHNTIKYHKIPCNIRRNPGQISGSRENLRFAFKCRMHPWEICKSLTSKA